MISVFAVIVVVTNIGFTVGFDTERKQPAWVSYDLEPEEAVVVNRVSCGFRADPRFPDTDLTPQYKAMAGRYDRGHLAPAADFNWSTDALKETYYFSNVCPMLSKLNRGRWSQNEKIVRTLAKLDTVHVLVYPVYGNPRPKRLTEGWLFETPTSFVKVAWGSFGVLKWEEENR